MISKMRSDGAAISTSSMSFNMASLGFCARSVARGDRFCARLESFRFGGHAGGDARTVRDRADLGQRAVDEDLHFVVDGSVRALLEPAAALPVHEPRVPSGVAPAEKRLRGDGHHDVL